VRPVEKFEAPQLVTLMTEYNRAAKRGNRAPQLAQAGQVLDLEKIFRSMDVAVLKEVRTKTHSEVAKFQGDVQRSIDAGIPIIWSVMLGIFPEPGVPQKGRRAHAADHRLQPENAGDHLHGFLGRRARAEADAAGQCGDDDDGADGVGAAAVATPERGISLVPKLHLGRHFSAKLHFAIKHE